MSLSCRSRQAAWTIDVGMLGRGGVSTPSGAAMMESSRTPARAEPPCRWSPRARPSRPWPASGRAAAPRAPRGRRAASGSRATGSQRLLVAVQAEEADARDRDHRRGRRRACPTPARRIGTTPTFLPETWRPVVISSGVCDLDGLEVRGRASPRTSASPRSRPTSCRKSRVFVLDVAQERRPCAARAGGRRRRARDRPGRPSRRRRSGSRAGRRRAGRRASRALDARRQRRQVGVVGSSTSQTMRPDLAEVVGVEAAHGRRRACRCARRW